MKRSTGIEDIRRYEKSLDFQGFFAIERQCGRQNFEDIEGLICAQNKLNMRVESVLISLILLHKMQNGHTMYEFKWYE